MNVERLDYDWERHVVDGMINWAIVLTASRIKVPEPLIISNMAYYCSEMVGHPLDKYGELLFLVKNLVGGREVIGEPG